MAVDPVTMMTIANAAGGMTGGNQQGGGLSNIVQGAASGAMIANPVAGVGMGLLGAFQRFKGNKLRKKADALQPQLEDPAQVLRLAELTRRRNALEKKGFQTVNEQLQNLQKQSAVNIRRMGGGSGAAIAGIAKSAKGIAEIMGKLGVQAKTIGEKIDDKVGATTDLIAQRKLELQLARQSKLEARAEQLRKAGGQNLAAGVASIAKGGKKMPKMNFGDGTGGFAFGDKAFDFQGDMDQFNLIEDPFTGEGFA